MIAKHLAKMNGWQKHGGLWLPAMRGFRFSPGCCCGGCEYDGEIIRADGTATWFSHSVSDGVISRVENEVPCKTFYVDSDSGGVTETGSGTEEDPWVNLNTVFSDNLIYFLTILAPSYGQGELCPAVKVLVKGTIDYATLGGDNDRNHRLIFEPWGNDEITISIIDYETGYLQYARAFVGCYGCVFKSVSASVQSALRGVRVFAYCNKSIFNNCAAAATCTYSSGTSTSHGFMASDELTLDYCDAVISQTNSSYHSVTIGFYCPSSTCYGCEADVTGTGGTSSYAIGFYVYNSSVLNECESTVAAVGNSGYGYAIGYNSTNSVYNNCDCDVTATGSDENETNLSRAYGFNGSSYAAEECDAVAAATGPNYRAACGFYGSSPSIVDCTSSAPVCVGCSFCSTWSCNTV